MNKNRKCNKRKDKIPTGIPTGIMRLDDTLMSEIKMLVSLGKTVSEVSKIYHVSENMVIYSCRNGKSFEDLQKEFIEKEDI